VAGSGGCFGTENKGGGRRDSVSGGGSGDAIGDGILQLRSSTWERFGWGDRRAQNEDDDAATRVRLEWAECDGGSGR